MGETTRPASVAERAIAQGQGGKLDSATALWTIAASEILLLNEREPPAADFPDAPLVLGSTDGAFLPVFTHQDQLGAYAAGRVPVLVPAFELLRRVPDGVGLVVNPGNQLGMTVPADGLRAFVTRLLEPLNISGT